LAYFSCEPANLGVAFGKPFEESTQFGGGVPAGIQFDEPSSSEKARSDDAEVLKGGDRVLHRDEVLAEQRRDLARIGGFDEDQQLQDPLAKPRPEKGVRSSHNVDYFNIVI
jgi:hypothetical protein